MNPAKADMALLSEDNGNHSRIRRRQDASSATTDIGSMIKITKSDIADELHSAESATKRLEKQNRRLTEQLKDANNQISHLEEEISRRERNNQEAQIRLEETYKKSKYNNECEIRDLQFKLDSMSQKYEDLKSDNEEKMEKVSGDYEKRIQVLTKELTEVKRNLREESSEDQKIIFLEKLKAEKEERVKLEAEMRKMENKIREMERIVEQKESMLQDSSNEILEVKKELEEVSTEKMNLKNEVRRLKKDTDDLEDLRSQLERSQGQLETYKSDLKESKTKLDDLESDKKKLEREFDRLKSSGISNFAKTTYSRDSTTTNTTTTTTRSTDAAAPSYSRGRELYSSYDKSSRSSENPRERSKSRTAAEDHISTSSSNEIRRLERENERKISDLEDKIRDDETELKKITMLYEQEKAAKDELEKINKQEKLESKQRVDLALEKVDQITKQMNDCQSEITKLQKALQKKDRDLNNSRLKYEEHVQNFNLTKNNLGKAELQIKQLERTLESLERKLKESESVKEKTIEKLTFTTEDLHMTTQTLDETRIELSQLMRNCQANINVLEEELYIESVQKEKLLKNRAELQKEIQMLRWYFKPLAIQEEESTLKTVEFNWDEECRKERRDEIKRLFAPYEKNAIIAHRTITELQQCLTTALTQLPDTLREDLSYELGDLMRHMVQAKFKTRTKLAVFVALVENKVDPGIVRELANITLEMNEGRAHIMDSPETIIKFAYRDSAVSDDPNAFKLALLTRLAIIKSKKIKKDPEYCKIIILEGGEYDD